MEILSVTSEMREQLRKPLPPEAIKPHPTKTYLSSIKAIYVTERLSDVFGIGSWQTKVSIVEKGDKSMVVVKVDFSVPKYGIYYECFGGNDNGGENSKNFDLGDAYKGATTDAITKIGSYLEIGLDVFKGKSTLTQTPKGENNQQNNTGNNTEKPWLNPGPKYNAVTKRLREGTTTIEEVKQHYRVSKTTEDSLQIIVKEQLQNA